MSTTTLTPDVRDARYARMAERRARYHVEAPDYVRTGRARCGADIGRAGFYARSLVEALATGRGVCKRCAPAQTLADVAESYAAEDIARIAGGLAAVPATPDEVIVDGSMFAPSWRALYGGSAAWDLDDPDALDVYAETLDEGTDALGLYWDEGMLRAAGPDEDDDEGDEPAMPTAGGNADGARWPLRDWSRDPYGCRNARCSLTDGHPGDCQPPA